MSTLPITVLWLNFVCVAVALLGFVWLAHSLKDYTWDAIICFAGSFFVIYASAVFGFGGASMATALRSIYSSICVP